MTKTEFNEYLDGIWEPFMGVYTASEVFKKIDSIAYEVMYSDWCRDQEMDFVDEEG